MKSKNKSMIMAYASLITVVFIWAIVPLAKKALIGDLFSASVYTAITAFSSGLILLIFSAKHLKKINRTYFKIAIPTGLCVGIASLMQAIAYNFNASPTNQAFLENISCIAVPLILLIMIKKKPSLLTVLASIICLFSSMVLAGVFSEGLSFHAADILNAMAGIFYGINIAMTGIYAKKLVSSLFVMIQIFVQSILSTGAAVAFHLIRVDGVPIDPFRFVPEFWPVVALLGIGILSNAVCWTIRTTSMKQISPTVVAVIMPFSAVITGISAVVLGQDQPSFSLLFGALLGLAASILSGFGDLKENNPKT